MQRFSKDDLPTDPGGWRRYRKTSLTRILRITGPFEVETAEGALSCSDGYLAIDARGYPYPIAANEFEQIYEPVGV